MFGEIKNKMVQIFGSTAGRNAVTSDGNWRAISVGVNGLQIEERATFFPVANSNKHLHVTAVSACTPVLPLGKELMLYSTVPCHIVFGNIVSLVATANDPHIPASVIFPFILDPLTISYNCVAVLKSTLIVPTPADGILFVFQSERP
jgi:hypothetical protein